MRLIIVFVGLVMLSMQPAVAQLDGSGIAPDFTLIDIDGESHHLYDYLNDNKVVVLDFFAVWCSICKADAEYLEAVYDTYGPDGSNQIEMLSLEADNVSTDDQTRSFANEFGGGNPHINNTGQVPDLYALNGFPTYYVIAPDRSYYIIGGRQESMQSEMEAAILSAPLLRTVENDVRVLTLSSPFGSICEDIIGPNIRIQNYGKNEIAGLVVETIIDGEVASVYPYNETLEPYHIVDLKLPEVVSIGKGWHLIEIRFTEVNGEDDGDPDNGIKWGDFLILPDGEQVKVSLTTDPYPKETSWRILQEGKTLAFGDGYVKGLVEHLQDVCVEAGNCYQLVIYDQYGDGMSNGGIQLNYQGDVIAEIKAGDFSSDSVSLNFCVWPVSDDLISKSNDLEIKLYPNPGSGEFTVEWSENIVINSEIEVLNTIGRVLLSKSIPRRQNYTRINLSGSPNGIYFVRLMTNYGPVFHKVIVKR